MGSDALYNEQALLWAVIRFVCAVTGMRRPPRRRRGMGAGSACGVIRRRRFLWGVMRFVWAVSHIWTAPPVRAEVYAGSTRPHPRGAEVPMGSDTFYNKRRLLWEVGTLCLGCNLHEDSPAPAVLARRGMGAGSACRAGQPAFMRAYRIRGARRFLWEVIRPIMSKRSYGKWYALCELYLA